MLHFFKSPYLRPGVETGIPEVEDPAKIQLAQDPAVAAASKEVIERHHEEMLDYLPELEHELVESRAKPSERTHDTAQCERRTSILRRHFASYLFRRERARRIALDADGVVIDVIRSPSESEHAEQSGLLEAVEGYEVILQAEHGIEQLRVSVPNVRDAAWLSLHDNDAALASLHAGRRGDLADGQWIVAGADRAPTLGSCAAEPNESAEPALVTPRGDEEQALSLGEQPSHEQHGQSGIVADAQAVSGLVAGQPLDSRTKCLIQARDDNALGTSAAAEPISVEQRRGAMLSTSGDEKPAEPAADRAREPGLEPVILAPDNQEDSTGLRAGAVPVATTVLLTGTNEDRSIWIDNGRALDLEAEPGIRPQTEEGREWPAILLVSRAHDPDGDAAIRGRDDEALRLTAVDGGKAAHPHEKAILAGGDDEWMTSLLAGAGVGRISERVILAQEDEWLRPSLVAG